MKIDSGTIGMESARSYKASTTTVRRFVIRDYQAKLAQGEMLTDARDSGAAVNGQEEETQNQTEGTNEKVASLEEWQNRFGISHTKVSLRATASDTVEDIRQVTLRYIFDMLFAARRNRLSEWMKVNGWSDSNTSAGNSNVAEGQSDGLPEALFADAEGQTSSLKVLSYTKETWQMESEETSFSTVGTVRTADGREINFNVNVGMSREFQQYYQEDLNRASFKMCDPLVINLDRDVAELSDQTFYFDIDGDGEKDEVSQLNQGSGYLALDKNGDGTINDGKELFGTESGNGFGDLAKYDQDGNGWIDEGDAVWSKLKIWCKNEKGEDVLYRLADKGVGAICLQNAATDFTLKGAAGNTKGAIRNTGIFLYENGAAGTVQHVDVAKYQKQA